MKAKIDRTWLTSNWNDSKSSLFSRLKLKAAELQTNPGFFLIILEFISTKINNDQSALYPRGSQ